MVQKYLAYVMCFVKNFGFLGKTVKIKVSRWFME